jgi:hypothetical protein
MATPASMLPLCIRFHLSRQKLLSLPAQLVRDFQTILNYETELAQSGR